MFASRIQHLCQVNHTAMLEFLQDLEISPDEVENWKDGVLPDINLLCRIADYFECPIDYLLERPHAKTVPICDTDKKFNRIKKYRMKLENVSQADIASDINRSESTFSKWERGVHRPSEPENYQLVADYFHKSADDVWGNDFTAVDETFRRRLRQLMEERKTSTADLADYLCCTEMCIENYRNGISLPDLKFLYLLADFFDVPVDDFFPSLTKEV